MPNDSHEQPMFIFPDELNEIFVYLKTPDPCMAQMIENVKKAAKLNARDDDSN